jgi:hypothetical protein
MESCVILPIRFVSGYGPDKSPGLHPPVTQPFGQIIGKVESPMIRKDEKTAVIEANRTHPTDTGSPEVQIAILTARINELTEPDLVDKLDRIFSLFIRYRDTMPNGYFQCISCGKIKPFNKADCGHYINRQHMSTRFDEMNCNAQCSHCNRFMEGNIQDYRRRLVAKYGERNVLILEAKKNVTKQFSDFQLEKLITHYKEEAKKLKEAKGL